MALEFKSFVFIFRGFFFCFFVSCFGHFVLHEELYCLLVHYISGEWVNIYISIYISRYIACVYILSSLPQMVALRPGR